MENIDERCCGSGTCIINAEGYCWCGQQWNGSTMCRPSSDTPATSALASAEPQAESESA